MLLNSITDSVRNLVAEFGGVPVETVTADTQLIGPAAVVKSRALVEILLALEEFAEDELNTNFDWASDSAMSQNRSIFRTVGRLSEHLYNLQKPGE